MKKQLFKIAVALLVSASTALAQAPESFKYQAVVRDASNAILINQAVGMQLIIHQGSASGTAVYTETFSPTSNAYGLVNLEIGTGTTVDNFAAIDWSAGPYYFETMADLTGGTSYSSLGTSQLLSVPYALYSKTAESVMNDQVDDADADPTNEYNDTLVLNGNVLELTDGGGTITADLSSLAGGGSGNWTVNGNDIYNSNTGNVGVGITTPYHEFAVGRTDTTTMLAVGHIGNFNEVYSGGITFSEDINYSGGDCGLRMVHNGSTNSIYTTGGCTSFGDTAMRVNRNGYTNIRNLRLGTNIDQNSALPLTVDGNSSFTGDVTVTGNLNVTGNVSKGGGTFKIDHPLDPANKYLVHSFVESPEMMNVYSGNITTDANGYATVQMPDYFEAANKDFRYQLTVFGSFAQAIVKEKIANNKFVIQTNQPNIEVSWQITSVRSDKYANENRIVPVQEKEFKGTYIHPELYGASPDQGENAVREKERANAIQTTLGADGQ